MVFTRSENMEPFNYEQLLQDISELENSEQNIIDSESRQTALNQDVNALYTPFTSLNIEDDDRIFPSGHVLKISDFNEDLTDVDIQKKIQDLNGQDAVKYMMNLLGNKRKSVLKIPWFKFLNLTGKDIYDLNEEDFCILASSGLCDMADEAKILYSMIHKDVPLKNPNELEESWLEDLLEDPFEILTEFERLTNDDEFKISVPLNDRNLASCSNVKETEAVCKPRGPGRPKGSAKVKVKNVALPEFVRNLLLDPLYCPAYIRWENYELGRFEFVDPEKVAQLWGEMKKHSDKDKHEGEKNDPKKEMNYDKLTRAMRYYYKLESDIFRPVEKRRVYEFGKDAPNYQTDDPNFVEYNRKKQL